MLIPLDREGREKLAKWTVEKYDGALPDMYEALGFETNGKKAGAIFTDYNGHNINISIASESPIVCTRGHFKVGFKYAFIQLGCQRMTAVIKRKNKKSRRLAELLGFKLEGVMRNGAKDDDLIIYGILKDEYLKGKFVWD